MRARRMGRTQTEMVKERKEDRKREKGGMGDADLQSHSRSCSVRMQIARISPRIIRKCAALQRARREERGQLALAQREMQQQRTRIVGKHRSLALLNERRDPRGSLRRIAIDDF